MIDTDVLAWIVIATFILGALLEARDRRLARYVSGGAWMLFGVFWLALFPQFWFEMRSFIEGALSLVALPACVYTGYLLLKGRDSLFVLSRAVAVMGLIYLPAETIPIVRQVLIETVAYQTHVVMDWLGYQHEFIVGPNDYQSGFLFTEESGQQYLTYIVLACTGIGSMAIFGGLIAAVKAPLKRKLQGLVLAVAIIWVLNIARNVFIAVAFGNQWFQFYVDPLLRLTGYDHPGYISFFIADRVISQSLSVVALIGIAILVIRIVPELIAIADEVLFVLTGTEYDLQTALEPSVRADGGRD